MSLSVFAKCLIALVAVEHLYFFYLESFAWTKPRTRKSFGLTEADALATRKLALNQGVYNAFVAGGLIWALVTHAPADQQFAYFFLSCVVIAGIVGGITVNKKIFFLQSVPAIVGLAVLCFS